MTAMYFEAAVILTATKGKQRSGKFFVAGSSYIEAKAFLEQQLKEKYPEFKARVNLKWRKDIDGLIIQKMAPNEVSEPTEEPAAK